MSLKEEVKNGLKGARETLGILVKKTTVANVCAGAAVIGGLIFGIWIQSTEMVSLVTGAAIGYLFKTATTTKTETEEKAKAAKG